MTGGIYATASFHLHNDSNSDHLRLSEVASDLFTNPLGLFDFTLNTHVGISAYVEALSFEIYRYNIATIPLPELSFKIPASGPARTVTTLAGPPSATASYGQTVKLTATVQSGLSTGSVPVGGVKFTDLTTNTVLGTVLLPASSNGVATLPYTFTTLGNHEIQATFLGNDSYRTSVSTLSLTVTPANTTTTLSAPSPNPVYGQSSTVTATVSIPTGGTTFAGSVRFSIDGQPAFLIPLNITGSTGTAVLDLPSTLLATAVHTIGATYISSATVIQGNSTATPYSLTIGPAKTQTALAGGSPNPSVFGQPVFFQVSAVAPGAGTPTGVVNFTDATTGANLGSAPLVNGQATLPLTAATARTYMITAKYQGDSNFASSSTATPVQQVVEPAATSTAVSVSPNPVVVGNPVTLTAVVSAQSSSQVTPTGTVQFKVDGQNFGTPQPLTQTGTATLITTTLPLGNNHTVSAAFTDPRNNFSTSTGTLTGNLSIIPRVATTVTAPSTSPNPVAFGTAITLTATVLQQLPNLINYALPTGPVDFFDVTTDTDLGTRQAINGTASLMNYTVSLEPGANQIEARYYAGDSIFLPSVSPALTLTVLNPTEVTTNQDTSNPGQVSLRGAINYADSNPGSTITFLPSLAGQTISLTSPLPALSANVTIDGLGATQLSVKGTGVASVFVVSSGVTATISGLTITGGGSATGSLRVSGAGVANSGILTLSGDTVTGNTTYLSGGGVYNTGMLTVLDSTISNNQAAWGAGIANSGTLDVEGSTFAGNMAVGNNGRSGLGGGGAGGGGAGLGGALFNSGSGTATLVDSTISGNTAQEARVQPRLEEGRTTGAMARRAGTAPRRPITTEGRARARSVVAARGAATT